MWSGGAYGAMDAALGVVTPLLARLTVMDTMQRIGGIVAKARAAMPHASRAELSSGLAAVLPGLKGMRPLRTG